MLWRRFKGYPCLSDIPLFLLNERSLEITTIGGSFKQYFSLYVIILEGYREGYPYDVTVSRLENEGFGFVIISSVSRAGSTIGRIIPGEEMKKACAGGERF